MSWRIIYVQNAEHMKLKLDNIVINKNNYDYTVPLSDIEVIVTEGLNTSITTRLMASMTTYNISLVICDATHTPCGIFLSMNGHSRATKMLLKQMEWKTNAKDEVWQKIIKCKIENQKQILEIFECKQSTIQTLEKYVDEVEVGDVRNREGISAKAYFPALFEKNFIRDRDNPDVINGCLNYGYAIIRAYIARVCVGHGLVCMLGIHHKSEYNQFNLVDDLMEVFRPFVDYVVRKKMTQIKFIKSEDRKELYNILNKEVRYNNKKMFLSNVIEQYVYTFVKCLEEGEFEKFEMPQVESFGVLYGEV
jgi:CRISP-associated protein Cas1